MTIEKRKNWKQEVAENTKAKMAARQALMVEKELLSDQIHSLTMAEVRSDLYVQLKARQREILAELATL
jgi:hypothetical protein